MMGLEQWGLAQGWEGIRAGAEVAPGRQQAVLGWWAH